MGATLLIFIDFTSLRVSPGTSSQEAINAKKNQSIIHFQGGMQFLMAGILMLGHA
jgi:hypothetical protein